LGSQPATGATSAGSARAPGAADAHWLRSLLARVDARDTEGFADFLTDDATLRFANAEPVVGRAAIETVIAGFFQAIAGLSHELEESWTLPGVVICRGEVTYRRLDGGELRVPFANVLELRGEKISKYLIYVDNSALWASAAAAGSEAGR
jgi:ketosteroid isomerase-like protein